jgi:hypothetical protein
LFRIENRYGVGDRPITSGYRNDAVRIAARGVSICRGLKPRGRFADVPVLRFVWLMRVTPLGKSASLHLRAKQPLHTIAKASELEPSSTRLAAISVRNASETKL